MGYRAPARAALSRLDRLEQGRPVVAGMAEHFAGLRAEMNTNGPQRKEAGCIITFENPSGEKLTLESYGSPLKTVPLLCETALAIDSEFRVASYCTPETIFSDIDGARSIYQGGGEGIPTRPSLPEQIILGRLGLSHLLHPRIARATSERKLELFKARRLRLKGSK